MNKIYVAKFPDVAILISKIVIVLFLSFTTIANAYAQANNTSLWQPGLQANGPSDGMSDNAVLDAAPPVITYTPLASTCATTNQTLTATITDVDGVPTSGTARPVLYWQINSGTFTAVPGTSIGSNQFTFTFGAATAGSLISYYIVAQDAVGNVIAKPSAGATGYSTNPPAVSTPPTTPDFYVILTALSGSYNVGVGQPYVTITDAVNAYNNSCLGGPVTFLLTDANYGPSEVFPITIFNPFASATNTLTIKPNTGIGPLIQGDASESIFKLNGADYVTIDGSNSGGTTRNLTITNISSGLASTVIWVGSSSAANGATNNTIKNCNITGGSATTTFAGIMSSSGILSGNVAEAANSNNLYENNSINNSYQGVVLIGPSTGESNNILRGNTVGSSLSTKKLGYRGVVITNQTNVQVTGNSILGVVSTLGIGSDLEPTTGVAVSGVISGGAIHSNFISDIKNTNVSAWQAYGISLQSTSTAANFKVYNNFIHSITGIGNASTPAQNGIGINIQTGGGYSILSNSINLFVNQAGASGGISSCIYIGPDITGTASIDIRNNILSNRRTSGVNYAIYCSVPPIIFSNINYNDYYSTGFVGFLGSNRANIAAWQAATLLDGNSVTVNPIFVSTSNLHLQLISTLNDQGTTVAGITTDIDGDTRTATPDIGADEFTPPPCTANLGGTAVSDFITVCSSGSVILSATGFSFGLGIQYQWEKSTDNFATAGVAIPGETNPTSANPGIITQNTCYRLRVRCAAGAFGYSNVVCITVYNPAISSVTNGTRCGPGSVNLSAVGSPTTAIQWYTAATGGAPVYTGNPFATPSIAATTTYYAESTYLGSSGTVGLLSPNDATEISTQLTSWQVYFNVIQATKLLTVDVYPLAVGEYSVIDIYNSAGTVIASVPYTTEVGGGATVQTITMNVSLPIGNGYYLFATNGIPTTGLTRNLTGAVYPYNSSDIIITGNEFNPNFYMCYYRWRFSNGCSSSPRSPVTATVGLSSTLNVTATPSSICNGDSTTINVTSSNSAFAYTWTPGTLTGPTHTLAPDTTTTYTVNATDGTCTGVGSVTVTVNPTSSDVIIAPTTIVKCAGSPAASLTASGGAVSGIPILVEDFNGATIPSGWSTATTYAPQPGASTGTPAAIANCAWTLRPNNYSASSTTFRSNDLSQFFLSNSDANTGQTRTILRSPAFSLVGYTAASLSFYHYYAASGSAASDSICVEISQNGTTWTNIYSNYLGRGGSISFGNTTINLSAYIGQATNYIRFRYFATWDYQWAIDNVSITGANSGAPITWSPVAGLFTNAAGTTAYTGGPATNVYANPTTTTVYTATATPVNACQKSETINVEIRPVNAVFGPSSAVCPSGSATVTIDLFGTGPWDLTYTDGTTPVTVNGIATSPYSFTVNPLVTTTYSITALNDIYCSATAAEIAAMNNATVNVSATAFSTWIGTTSDWTDPENWCGGVPTATKDVVIPATANDPVISVANAVARDLSIVSGAVVTIDAGGVFSFKGIFVNNGTLTNNGRIVMNGSVAQTFPGGTTGVISAMNELEVINNAGVTMNRAFTIFGKLQPTAGNITLDNIAITLHSDSVATASVGILGATAGFTYTGAGAKFTVERFISSRTKTGWRFLSAPIGGTQTINEAWMEGETPGTYASTTNGMQIIGPGGLAMGYDLATTFPSLKTYKPSNNTWEPAIGGTMMPISTNQGYMAFIRGARTSNTLGSMSITTLRMSGPIKTGPVGPLSTATASGFISVGNPYPSAINFANTTRNGLQDTYYVWDPKLGQFGGYQTFTGPSYNATPGGNSYTAGNKFIESGQAFFAVATSGAVPHNISFTESCKVDGSFQVQRAVTTTKSLRTQLSGLSGGAATLIDGIFVEFDGSYSNDLDDLDAPKLTNFGENISIVTSGKIISVERHAEISNIDTIFYQLGQLKQQEYQLEFIPQDIFTPGLTAYLEDSYLSSRTEVSLDEIYRHNFTVNADLLSKAQDRFRLVFRLLGPVPVSFTSISAFPQEKDVMVTWKIENQVNIDHYEIERSSDGRSFSKIGMVRAIPVTGSYQYQWLDSEPILSDNFYRIKSVGIGSDVKYSTIAVVNMKEEGGLITVSPNPVKGRIIGLNFTGMPRGAYKMRLFGSDGKVVASNLITYSGQQQRIEIDLQRELSQAIYNLELILPDNRNRRTFRLMIGGK